MIRTALASMRAHGLRFALTGLSIVLGVAFVAGSLVFTDTINARFTTLFTDVYAGIDASVRPAPGDDALPASVLDEVRAVGDVATAAGAVTGTAQLVDAEGQPIGGQGPPTLGVSWIDEPALNAMRVDDGNGRAPAAADEVAIDVATAEAHDLAIGDTVTVATARGTGAYTIAGLTSFGTEDNLAGATITVFTLPEAQRVFDLEGRLSIVDAVAVDGVDQEAFAAALDAAIDDVEVVTGQEQTQDELAAVTSGLGFLGSILLAFAGVAVFVGGFVIQNTFRITVAQRVRELALLRALGATGGQVTRLVLLEASALALVGSGLGIGLGIGVAALLKSGMEAIGIGVPDGPLTVAPRTIVVSLVVGVVVTLLAALLPARRAAAIAPVAAMAGPTASGDRRSLQVRAVVGAVVTALGVAGTTSAVVIDGDAVLPLLAGGGIGLFLGLSILAPLVAVPAARLLAWPLRGVTGQLARENTIRQPRRTASTASALMIGVALVTFVSILAASIQASVADTLEAAFPAELTVRSTNPDTAVSEHAVAALAADDDLGTVSAVRSGHVTVDGTERSAIGIDPATIDDVYAADATIDLATIGDGVVVHRDLLGELGWAVGDVVTLTGAATHTAEVRGTYDQQGLAGLLLAADVLGEVATDTRIDVVLVDAPAGLAAAAAQERAEAALADFPTVRVDTQAETIAQAEAQVDQLVALFSGLLALALLIALLGIANTLALSVAERQREIGLLRAVGLARRQVRRMVRREAVIIAVFGALLGLAIGAVVGGGVVISLDGQGLGSFRLPVAQLVAWLALAAVAGVVAAVGPARTAARLDVLAALSTE